MKKWKKIIINNQETFYSVSSEGDVRNGVSNNKVEVFVPATSVSAYRSAKNWKNFKTKTMQ